MDQSKSTERSHDSEERSTPQPEQEGVTGETPGQLPGLAAQAEEEEAGNEEDQGSGDRALESGEGAGEEGQVVKEAVEEGEGKEGEEKEGQEEGEGEEGVRVVPEDEGATTDGPQSEASEEELMSGFAKEPFVVAAAQFARNQLDNILELLGDAIEKGIHTYFSKLLKLKFLTQYIHHFQHSNRIRTVFANKNYYYC